MSTTLKSGVDLVSISRIAKVLKENQTLFLDRICTEDEKTWLLNHKRLNEKMAGVFALKEAFSKAVGTGFGSQLGFQEVEVSYLPSGQPTMAYIPYPTSTKLLEDFEISCSLSHEGDMLVAFVVIQEKN